MSRLIFEARRRLTPPTTRKGTITIEAPPQLPRVIPPSLLRRAMPYLMGILIVGMIVAMVATGMRLISPQTLFFPFVMLLAATSLFRGNDNKMRTEEVDAERADYLRYLSVVRDNIRAQAAEQRAAAQWSHPEPEALASVPGSRRQWERDPHDPDFLVLRAGRHSARWLLRCGSTTPLTKSTWNRCRTAHYAACSTRSAPSVTFPPESTSPRFRGSPSSATTRRCALRCGRGWLRRSPGTTRRFLGWRWPAPIWRAVTGPG
ncbi:ESX-3 secretion system eccC3 domain protein [Mycobacterium kansasii]|uniref:ESX-3 secretion system eccC3 domain protein n=1 Tax=Mycobacterium kansasii TaxID=1768 RepID=A0A1V3WRC0_MYCKA|nr:ESX-3 secretion system eccC3 domain protein [Mycobacterium kansasii]